MSNFEQEISSIINKYSLENVSNTPDFILARYLNNCLDAFNSATKTRSKWYGTEEKENRVLSAEHEKPNTVLYKYIVVMQYYKSFGYECFECMAENDQHAEEQAFTAYSEMEYNVVGIIKTNV